MNVEAALSEYDSRKGLYAALQDVTVPLLTRLLEANGLSFHSITPRIKSRESLREKLGREGKDYSQLADVKDVVGIRIITYFEDELEKIDRVIKREFTVSEEDSYDRRSQMESDRFGYRSIHYVCSYSPSRLAMDEYKHLGDGVIEIQTRSILQHAWAEIEHEYYKVKGSKPENVKRRNSRLAGLLELADAEFISIRQEMEAYRKNIDLRVNADQSLEDVKLDSVSLVSFLEQDEEVKALDRAIAAALNAVIRQDTGNVEVALKALKVAGVETLEELRRAIRDYTDALPSFMKNWVDWNLGAGRASAGDYPRGISMYHLGIFIAALKGQDVVMRAFQESNPRFAASDRFADTVPKLVELASVR